MSEIDQIVAYQGELMLLGWAESHTRGRTVTFLVPDDEPDHPFKRFTVKNGRVAGQRFMAALVQVDDNEQPVKQEPAKLTEPEQKGGELAKWAGMLSGDGRFVHWAVVADRELWDECFRVTDPVGDYGAVGAEFIRRKCGVKSRRELDHNKQAGLTFREEIMAPFHQWRERQ